MTDGQLKLEMMAGKYNSFSEFYPHYLSEHRDPVCRRLHVGGTLFATAAGVYAVATQSWLLLLLCPVIGYGSSWIGHFFFEKNKPATFENPVYSLIGDWAMIRDVARGKLKL